LDGCRPCCFDIKRRLQIIIQKLDHPLRGQFTHSGEGVGLMNDETHT
jgi:hypothetical protein